MLKEALFLTFLSQVSNSNFVRLSKWLELWTKHAECVVVANAWIVSYQNIHRVIFFKILILWAGLITWQGAGTIWIVGGYT